MPPAVAAALAAELAALAPEPRRLLDAAAVAGDPFEPGLAAAIAELPEPAALQALDELLRRALVRPAGAPRRFAFRHPVVRHAVYVAAGGGWRLGAHARAAVELERRGAGPVALAHHVEHAAGPGDEDAIALLSAAATELQASAPATAARFHAAVLRLLPDTQRERRTATQRHLADAQAAAGDPYGARATLHGALAGAGPADRLVLTIALANLEWWLGGHEDARRRLYVVLGELPAEPSPDRVRLRLALGLTALLACDLDEARAQTADARDDARAIGDPAFEIAALASGALAAVSAADRPDGERWLEESSAALERLSAAQLQTRLPAFWMQGRARRGLGQFEAALADLRRGAELAERTGRERVLLMLTIESVATLVELGRIAEATAAGEEGVERARLAGSARILLWAQCALASARLAAGDVAAALRLAGDAAAAGTRPDFHAAGQPGWCLGAALVAAGNPQRGREQMLDAFGGPGLPGVLPVDRPAATADLVEAHLACGDVDAAEQALAGLAAAPILDIARSAVLLARERPREAVEAAAQAHTGAPLLAARARLAEGQALAGAGERDAAREALIEAEAAFDGYGALRLRSEATRELPAARPPGPARRDRAGRRAADRARARDRGTGRRRTNEPRGGRAARAQHPHDRGARAQHLRQARRPVTGRAGAELRRSDRQADVERRAAPGPRPERQRPAVPVDDRACDREPLTCPVPDLLGREERIEHTRGDVVRDARAGVRDGQDDLAVERAGAQRDGPARVVGVLQQVDQDLLDRARVAHDRRERLQIGLAARQRQSRARDDVQIGGGVGQRVRLLAHLRTIRATRSTPSEARANAAGTRSRR